MDRSYKAAFAGLNDRQRDAVETIEGPVLVIAGPGTGKTQLVGTRVGYILQKTDTPPDAILLLTFTEAGVQAMRERLARLIGRPAYDVQLSTYHAFGGEIFRRYPDYFEGANLSLIEELGADTLLRGIIAKLPYSNPLKFADNYLNEVKSFISEAKRALLEPEAVQQIAEANDEFIESLNLSAADTLQGLQKVSKAAVPVFEKLNNLLGKSKAGKLPKTVKPLAGYASDALAEALAFYDQTGKTTELTKWKRAWLAKDAQGRQIMDGQRLNRRLAAAAGIYAAYQQSLKDQNLYDYDDMILRAIEALESNPELKYSLAERYSYVMLDEFQDTNPAQFKLVQLLTDHPVHEGRPNILAVGDDDQAIYAFQGAEQGNMAAFAKHYKGVKVISLEENYRSWPEIIEAGQKVAGQIQTRLHQEFEGIDKTLVAAAKDLPGPPLVDFRRFDSDAAQYGWVARKIKQLIKSGVPAGEIAVLAPKHRFLAPLLPYLTDLKLPVRYERRENILDEPLVYQLERMSQLTLALADGDETLANSIWPEVLSYTFWKVPTEKIWRLNWQSRSSHEPWTAALLNDENFNQIASFFLKLASLLPTTSFEQQLDALVGLTETTAHLELPLTSPLYEHYFSRAAAEASALEFTKLISELSVLRASLRGWRRSQDGPISLRTFVEFTEGHRAAKLNLLNTSPYHENQDAVELLTAYGAKGREFQAVFMVGALDEIWGSASRNQGYRLGLPANLSHIRYQGASEDERLRLLFVAATRARSQLYLTSYAQDMAGKKYTALKYLDVQENESGELISGVLPAKFSRLNQDDSKQLQVQDAAHYWQDRHLPPLEPKLKEVLKPALARYQLSATHLNYFTDLVNSGPLAYFMACLLRFPGAPSLTSAFGTAMHNSLRAAGVILARESALPTRRRLEEIFEAQLGLVELPPDEAENLMQRGRDSLGAWLTQRGGQLNPSDRFEYDFQSENSACGEARLAGKIDRMVIDEKAKQITVYDYKTGAAYQRWQSGVIKLHKFRQQLMFYKLLVESSARFRGYSVTKGVIEFVEPDEDGNVSCLELDYDSDELKNFQRLISAVWAKVQELDFPDTGNYPPTIGGIRQFEDDLAAK